MALAFARWEMDYLPDAAKSIALSAATRRSSLAERQRKLRWAIVSPIAKNRCCTSSSRRNSTGTSSAAQSGAGDEHTAAPSSPSRASWCARNSATRTGMPRKGRPCDGSTSVSAGRASQRGERIQKARKRIAVGFDRPDADVGADFRQQHVTGDQHAGSGRIERGVLRRMPVPFDDPPFRIACRMRVAVEQPIERLWQFGHPAAVAVAALCERGELGFRHSVPAKEVDRCRRRIPAELLRRLHVPKGTRRGSSRPAHGTAPKATRRCRHDRDGSGSR